MPNGYSNDLRARILAYYDNNHTQIETCQAFQIARSTLCDWLRRRLTLRSAHLQSRPLKRRSKINKAALRAYCHSDLSFLEKMDLQLIKMSES